MEKAEKNTIKISKVWKSIQVNDGDGVNLQRVIGTKQVDYIDPFLMLDHIISIKLPAGFPDHPHRGFETVTYILKGKVLHEDIKGHKGEIGPGEVQWMTAGKGIVHAEMPFSKDEESSGFQLWINLKSDSKMINSKYQEYKQDKIPQITEKLNETELKIIAGNYNEHYGPCKSASSDISFIDICIQPKKDFTFQIGKGRNGFLYVFEGESIFVDDVKIPNLSAGLFTSGEDEIIIFKNNSDEKAKFLLIFGIPLNEKVEKYGPFVMNTKDEIYSAFNDYQTGKNGFEGTDEWRSQIRDNKNIN